MSCTSKDLDSTQPETLDFCEECIKGKATRVKFARALHRTNGILEYVHSDLWGSSMVPLNGGARYFISIIDDFTRRVWI